jgi:hypothetical protein
MSPSEPKNQPSKSRYREVFLALAISSLVSAVVLAGGFVGDKQEQSGGIVLTGVVSDTTCGYSHGAGGRGDAVCTRDCVSYGAGYALAVGKKVYFLQGHRPILDRFAGETVIVKGKVRGRDTVAVESVTPVIIKVLH